MKVCLVFDMGGTFVKYGICTSAGMILHEGCFETPESGMDGLLSSFFRVYAETKKEHEVEGIAISSPGAVYDEEGVVRGISAIRYIHEGNFKSLVSECLDGLPVRMENDANCALLGEIFKGGYSSRQNIAMVVSGTGIGGAYLEEGRLLRGRTHNGCEFGNFPMVREQGHHVLTWSDFTIVKQAAKYVGKTVNGKELVHLYKEGDSQAAVLVEEYCYYMAVGCLNIQFCMDPDLILIGGGISEDPRIMDMIGEQVDLLLQENRFGFARPRIEGARFGNRANLYGALYHYHQQERIRKKEHEI